MDIEPTGESIAACVTCSILIAAGVAGVVFAWRWWRSSPADDMDRALALMLTIGAALFTVTTAVGFWWGMYPWKAEYHQWRPASGVVSTMDTRLVGLEDKYVVKFVGSPQQWGLLDTRAASVKPGDTLTITCVKRWQWSGAHGYDCNFVSLEPAR